MRSEMGVVVVGVDTTAREVLECVCDTFLEAEKPVCRCYAVTGRPVIGPVQCCECGPDPDGDPDVIRIGEAILQVEQIYDADENLNPVDNRIVTCRKGLRALDLTIWITRCYPTIDGSGDLDHDAIDTDTSSVHDDMDLLFKAFACCYQGRLRIRRIALDSDPEGGCSMIVGQVTVELPR